MKHIIQIAGIIDAAEAQLLLDSGVDWLGFPLRLTVNAEDINDADAAAIIANLPENRSGVLITYLNTATEILELCKTLHAKTVQIHGNIEFAELRHLRKSAPDVFILKSLIVRGDNLSELENMTQTLAPLVDGFITDTHDPVTGADGATGKTHDWQISRKLVEISPKPLMLAGGLTPENVFDAIRIVRPAAVDAHTVVEAADGRKSAEKVATFVREARRGFALFGG